MHRLRGFSLIELLIVMAIILALAAMAVATPLLQGQTGRRGFCLDQITRITQDPAGARIAPSRRNNGKRDWPLVVAG
jgi:prepilin-type N-terminal cleavage/methylation domain-containing protein